MYPIKLKSIYFEKIWGGRDLNIFKDDVPDGNIGESWEVSCHPHGTNIIINGEYQGLKLTELINREGKNIVGSKMPTEKFPLLLKFINSADKLSIQVHPDDEYGKRVENELGKTEAWYVMDAKEGAALILGVKENCSKEQFKKAIENGTLEDYMEKIPVKKGDVYFIKSGLMHAICEGVIIAEIQQNSDTTYRVYDYNRGRELHVQKALDVVNLSLHSKNSTGVKIQREGYCKTYLCESKEFALEKYTINTEATEISNPERFYIFTCIEGQGQVEYSNGKETIKKGESVLIPATLGKYTISGNLELLKMYVPNLDKVKEEILSEVIK
ncbi:mannose-6-phosphate isomerase, class I [Clostridium oryzae]|uniref:mannose-6-phosphate isomerase n=1 Tax=Clostridium oryzae TaxID=1450648 RepID=A0A1V4IUQ9_9CLOT|nr:mannose-6-phosphate isomerase, class I [Clostridium oryzae]OPJ63560.1 putative mannose-6-phosphate isomerase YvyI [Clostridium oryzae]